jgi:hypothetical protein
MRSRRRRHRRRHRRNRCNRSMLAACLSQTQSNCYPAAELHLSYRARLVQPPTVHNHTFCGASCRLDDSRALVCRQIPWHRPTHPGPCITSPRMTTATPTRSLEYRCRQPANLLSRKSLPSSTSMNTPFGRGNLCPATRPPALATWPQHRRQAIHPAHFPSPQHQLQPRPTLPPWERPACRGRT